MKNIAGLKLGHGWNKGLYKKRYCEVCEKEFGHPGCNTRKKTCSWECRSELIKLKRKNQIITEEHKKAISDGLKGKPKTKEHTLKISGKNNYNWKGGTTKDPLRGTFEYKKWAKSVYKRDYWTCQMCNEHCNAGIQAHHIFSWKNYPSQRFNTDNGITLCSECHNLTRKKEDEWIGYFIEINNIVKA